MTLTRFLPHEVRRNSAGAIYGVILGSSISAAAVFALIVVFLKVFVHG